MRKSQFNATSANLIFKQIIQRLYQRELQIFRQTSHVMMRFYYLRCLCSALHDIGINSSLRQEINPFQLSCFFFKNTDKFSADDLSLLFRICNALQFTQKSFRSIHIDQVCIHLIFKYFHNTLRLTFSHETMVYMNAYQLFTDCFDQKRCYYRTVHSAGESQQNFFVPYLPADQFYLIFHKVFHIPVRFCLTGIKYEWFYSFTKFFF